MIRNKCDINRYVINISYFILTCVIIYKCPGLTYNFDKKVHNCKLNDKNISILYKYYYLAG